MRDQIDIPLISLVVPFYNEGDAVTRFFAEVMPLMEAIESIRFEIVCVNDGSRDDTLEQLVAVGAREPRVRVIDLTRNFGKEAALTAGLDEANGDAVIPIDADLQDPPSLIPVMIDHWRDGAEVVAAKRSNRACDTFAKRTAAALYYRVHNALSEVKLPVNVGDFRLMDRQVVNALRSLPERRRFMKGLFAWVGYRTVIVEYQREARCAGPRNSPAGSSGTSRSKGSRASARCRCAVGPTSGSASRRSRSSTAGSSSRARCGWAIRCRVTRR